jgi:UDP-3-O-[3-hydroxymyristoyl] N-acetylglucosamine deacetylase
LRLHGPEVPALDGTAAPFYRALMGHSERADTEWPVPVWTARRPISLRRGRSAVALLPADRFCVSGRFDVRERVLRLRRISADRFAEIMSARTFAYAEEVESLRHAGLATGGSLDNALVLTGRNAQPLNAGGLRYPDEPLRHKMVDAFGDAALLGAPLHGHLICVRAGHRLVLEFLRQCVERGTLFRSN